VDIITARRRTWHDVVLVPGFLLAILDFPIKQFDLTRSASNRTTVRLLVQLQPFDHLVVSMVGPEA
jgi:hypothetical protein